MVAASPSTRPPAFILAGSLDKTVPIRQAYLLCDAYGGMGQGEAVVVGERHVKTTYRCGTSSHFHKLEGAGHLFTQRCDHLSKVLTSCNGRVDPARNAAIQSSRQELLDWLLGRI